MGLLVVERQPFLHRDADAPAVHEDVMEGPDQVPALGGQAHQADAHQWRFIQLQGLRPLLQAQLFQGCLWVGAVLPVQFSQGQVDVLLHHLIGVVQLFPEKRAAQHGVALHQRLPGTAKGVELQRAVHFQAQLLVVHPRIRFKDTVKQQAVLGRRKGVDVFDVVHAGLVHFKGLKTVGVGLAPRWSGSDPAAAAPLTGFGSSVWS